MTERLYYDNSYLTRFAAKVTACEESNGKYRVQLDRSAFYPTSGGQPYDTGKLNDANVLDVIVEKGDVWHIVDQSFEIGAEVEGEIDWPRRWDHMQQHAADHLIAGMLFKLYGGVTIGLHESDEVSTIDVDMPDGATHLTDEQVRRVEMEVNERIQRDVPIRCWFPSAEELETLPLRKKPTVSEHVRIVAIGDDEMVACGGTHPSTAGQIGLVKIVGTNPARGKMRLGFVAGMRALKDYMNCYQSAHEAAGIMSTSLDKLPAHVAAMQEKLKHAEYELNCMRREKLLADVPNMIGSAEVLPSGAKLVAQFVEADAALLRDLASKLIEEPGVIALLGAMNGDNALYVFGRSADVDENMGKLLQQAAKPLGGKGGGRPDFAQGGGCPEIMTAAADALKGARA